MQRRKHVFDTYWYFAAERQSIFFNKLRKVSPPYTQDLILQKHKFCNAYRASDRVSQFLIRDVIYAHDLSPKDILFRILFFRLFNKIETWRTLEDALEDTISLKHFDKKRFAELLSRMKEHGAIYGNAFILASTNVYGLTKKHENHLALLEYVCVTSSYADLILKAHSLQELFYTLQELPMIGPFMAYQLAIDLNYSALFDFDEDDFTIAGPGALRGIAKCFLNINRADTSKIIQWMVIHQEEEFARLGLSFQSLFGRRLHAIDCQGLFCETDKYARAKFPELVSNRKRIKAQYTPVQESITYFYPPKWGLDVVL